MRFSHTVSFATHKDVHTALHMAGTLSSELINSAIREYIVNHNHPAGLADVQANAATMGLGMDMTAPGHATPLISIPTPPFEFPSYVPPTVAAAYIAPPPVAIPAAIAVTPVAPMPATIDMLQASMPVHEPIEEALKAYAHAQLMDS